MMDELHVSLFSAGLPLRRFTKQGCKITPLQYRLLTIHIVPFDMHYFERLLLRIINICLATIPLWFICYMLIYYYFRPKLILFVNALCFAIIKFYYSQYLIIYAFAARIQVKCKILGAGSIIANEDDDFRLLCVAYISATIGMMMI